MQTGLLRLGALLILVIAGLHIVSVLLSGLSVAGIAALLPAVVCVAVAIGLWRGWRWLAWLAMLAAIVAFGAVLGRIGPSPVPDGVLYLLAAAYGAFAVIAFAALWLGQSAKARG